MAEIGAVGVGKGLAPGLAVAAAVVVDSADAGSGSRMDFDPRTTSGFSGAILGFVWECRSSEKTAAR